MQARSRRRAGVGPLPAARGLSGLLAVLGVALLLVGTTDARAQQADTLDGAVTDRVGALDGDPQAAQQALQQLRQRHDVDLRVLFVDSTGGTDIVAYAEQVAFGNALGGRDALLVVAVGDRTYGLWVADGLDQVGDRDIDDVLGAVRPRLADGDYPGAVVIAAEALGEASAAPAAPVGGGVGLGAIVGVALLVIGGVWLVGGVRELRRRRREDQERDRRTRQVAREANRLLIATDEAVRDAAHELDFAEAQFGSDQVAGFRDALGRCREELAASFALRQALDDDQPEAAEERERMLREIIERSRHAQSLLDEQQAHLEQLRDLERNAPGILEELGGRLDRLQARAEEAEPTLQRLERDAPRSHEPVRGNLVEARKRLEDARAEADAGLASAAAGDRAAAARSAREAQEATAQAVELLDALEHLAGALDEARQRLPERLRSAQAGMQAAEAALGQGAAGTQAARLAEGQATLRAAGEAAERDPADVLAAYELAERAGGLADEVLAGVREAEERRTAERAAAQAAMRAAGAAVTRAADYIGTRRRGVGREARTRLAEAERHLARAQAVADGDPAETVREARLAERLAQDAYRLAQADFDRYDSYGGGRMGGWPVPIPVPMGRGGWGGTRWGSPGRSGGFGGGIAGGRSGGRGFGGRAGGGGFGGRVGGGGFGGRAGGGRW